MHAVRTMLLRLRPASLPVQVNAFLAFVEQCLQSMHEVSESLQPLFANFSLLTYWARCRRRPVKQVMAQDQL